MEIVQIGLKLSVAKSRMTSWKQPSNPRNQPITRFDTW